MAKPTNRRQFLTTAALASALPGAARSLGAGPRSQEEEDVPEEFREQVAAGDAHRGPAVIGSGNALPSLARATSLMGSGTDPLDAVVAGVSLVENDPKDSSVGLGGLPNAEGVVQLDASCMHGPTHAAGSVGAIEGIQNPAQVALLVLKKTRHVMLVGEGAKRFALSNGFSETELLTESSRRAFEAWRASLNPSDNWLDPDQQLGTEGAIEIPYTTGTIHCSGLDGDGNMGSVTSTSGLSWKIPGRVGDSPIVGAGMYLDNAVGAAGATGMGEAVIQTCGANSIVHFMESGLTPTQACLKALRRIVDRTRRPHLLDSNGRPNFQVVFYALRQDGAYGSACLRPGGTFTIQAGSEPRRLSSVLLQLGEADSGGR